MTDYSNWREWKEVELWESEVYLQEYEEYSLEDVKNICDNLLQKGDAEGLKGCFLKFKSNMEPYEDCLGNPSVLVAGYRKLNSIEQKQIREDDAVRDMAKELNITEYEARMLKQLKDKGVV